MGKPIRWCEVEGCDRRRHGHGYCLMHYKRWRNHGDPLARLLVRDGPRVCVADGCTRPVVAKGLCSAHWTQQRAGRVVGPIHPRGSAAERLLAFRRIDENGCWIWIGHLSADGYGRASFGSDCRTVLVHRMAYQIWVGPITRQTIHHKCHVRACFNPSHLQDATYLENNLEMHERRSLRARIAELEGRVRELEEMLDVVAISDSLSAEPRR